MGHTPFEGASLQLLYRNCSLAILFVESPFRNAILKAMYCNGKVNIILISGWRGQWINGQISML